MNAVIPSSERARRAIERANKEARRLNHECVDTGHILLGIVNEDRSVAVGILTMFDADPSKIKFEIEELMPMGPDMVIMGGKVPWMPRIKRVIEYAIEEAQLQNLRYFGTEHLLLGLLRKRESLRRCLSSSVYNWTRCELKSKRCCDSCASATGMGSTPQ